MAVSEFGVCASARSFCASERHLYHERGLEPQAAVDHISGM